MTQAAVNQKHQAVLDASTPFVLILLGAPGSGKGTLASILSEHLQVPHISTGDLFRENIREQTPIGNQAKKFINHGNLVPDEVVLEMFFARLKGPDCSKGVILDGVPRTTSQAEMLGKKLEASHRFLTFVLDTDELLLIERICGRLVCQECGKSYHKKYNPPEKSACDDCDGGLIQRPDDTKETLLKRLEIYQSETEPLINYYKKRPGKIHTVNGGQTKDKVFKEILLSLDNKSHI